MLNVKSGTGQDDAKQHPSRERGGRLAAISNGDVVIELTKDASRFGYNASGKRDDPGRETLRSIGGSLRA